MLTKIKSRYTASAIHFSLSCSIFVVFISILLLFWFPEPYFTASGGWQGLKLVILVDLVLGPLLTLIIYNPNKTWKVLQKDLGLIALLQIVALVWGTYNVYQQRPIALAFYEKVFYTVPAIALKDQAIELSKFGNPLPVLVYVKYPSSIKEKLEIKKQLQQHNRPPHHQLNLYYQLDKFHTEIIPFAIKADFLKVNNSKFYQKFKGFLIQKSLSFDEVNLFILKGKYSDLIMIFKKDFQYMGAIIIE